MSGTIQQEKGIDKYSSELVWPDKKTEVERIVLPFQVVETINKPRVKQEQLVSKFPENYPKDWKNMLIWGDNKYIMSSLLAKFAGKINLIYIDPPFATGADFSLNMKVGDFSWVKEPSVIEELAYRDTWGKGLNSYLQMMYERLVLMRDLLADNGSIYVHLDWHVGHYVKIVMDEIFGRDNFRNEIVWCYTGPSRQTKDFPDKHDILLRYSKGNDYILNLDSIRVPYKKSMIATGRTSAIGRAADEELIELDKKGKLPEDWWSDIATIGYKHSEILDFPTQKPEALLERIIKASSNEGNLVADFFCGCGTTLAVAEKLGRRWIGADLSKFAIHVARKRMLDIDFCRPFDVLNLGNYQKYKFIENKHPPVERYLKFVLELYRAQKLNEYAFIHGRKDRRLVHIAGVDSIVTEREVRDAAEECANALGGKSLEVLGWDFEMGLDELVERIGQDYGITIRLLQIPKEAMEIRAPSREEVKFFDMNYMKVESKVKQDTLKLALKEFILANQEYVPEDIKKKIRKFTDYIDYWAVDFNYQNDTFHNMWQSFRTKKHPKLETKCKKTYEESSDYNVLVKVIDIFGNDTNKLLKVKV